MHQNDYIEKGKLKEPVRGIKDAFVQFSKVDGIASWWKGNGRSVMRIIPSSSLSFAVKDKLKRTFQSSSSSIPSSSSSFTSSLFQNIGIGAMAGGITMPLYYHLDSARIIKAYHLHHYHYHHHEMCPSSTTAYWMPIKRYND